MVRNKPTSSTAPHETDTPSCHSSRIRTGTVKASPGERFRALADVCATFVPVAAVADANTVLDENITVSPPPTKRVKRPTGNITKGGGGGIGDGRNGGRRNIHGRADVDSDDERKMPAKSSAKGGGEGSP
jgi:hypothetical protein